ncbi:hypothetical protein DAPPUDRAFT_270188 [Daphnia pulex]|uniref:CCHC-type domain-containing protein n=1 Tax=Daphnia pulex TaxID=6669 RepID=E9I0A1_DAPPU|nr:hypothetical protein DAPPUDRAFT_270188 [Daphnia pulex]|eukprot:EFX62579.1 hypothetical protein DAPPUDRAFT_270188 [Daphnia pulex]
MCFVGLSPNGSSGDQVVRVTLFKTADVTAILNQHGGARQHCIEGRQINVLIKDPNVEERFVRVSDYPANANMEVMKVRLREFGTVLDLRRDRYAGATAGVIPWLTGQLTVRMTLNSPIPSYLQVGEHKVYIRYANQPVTCRECNLPGHMALDCPARKNRLLPAPPKIAPQKTNGGKEKSIAAALQSASRPPSTPTEFPPLPDRSWTEVSRRKKNQNKTEGDETVLVPETPPIIVLPSAESSTEIVVESQEMETLSAEPTPTGEVLLDLAREHGRTDMSSATAGASTSWNYTPTLKDNSWIWEQSTPPSLTVSKLGASFLDSVGSRPQIPDLTSPPTLIDLTAVVTRLPSNKSPGEDGIPYDFYKTILGCHWARVFGNVHFSFTRRTGVRVPVSRPRPPHSEVREPDKSHRLQAHNAAQL